MLSQICTPKLQFPQNQHVRRLTTPIPSTPPAITPAGSHYLTISQLNGLETFSRNIDEGYIGAVM